MTLTASTPEILYGVATPRIAPPLPATSGETFVAAAKELGIELMPWQKIAGRYLSATNGEAWRYREVCIVVARQNGKTELLMPRIMMSLQRGERVLHTAQNRTLPREVFLRVAHALSPNDVVNIRYANGQEKIEMRNGGSYKVFAPQRGARGLSADLLIFDEVREQEDGDLLAAAKPTLTASPSRQIIYLSNAGSDASVVLNGLKRRGEAGDSDGFAYLEWSASPDRALDDRDGWAEANPALGHLPGVLESLEDAYEAGLADGMALFQTEHLCQWVVSMRTHLVSDAAWMRCRTIIEEEPVRPIIAFNLDPAGKRASAVMSWPMTDGRVALVQLAEYTGDPVDVRDIGRELKELAAKHGAKRLSFASWTDKALAAYLPRAEAMDGKDFATASGEFVRLVTSGRLAWDGTNHVTDDLSWTARKPHESGAWQAAAAAPERSITAINAAIRASYLASLPRQAIPRIG